MTHDTSRDVLVRQCPSQREVAHVGAQLFGELGQFSDLLQLRLALVALEELGFFGRGALDIDGESGALGESVVVFAREDTLLEWRPDRAVSFTYQHWA